MKEQSVLNIIISNQYNFTRLLFVQSTHWIQIIKRRWLMSLGWLHNTEMSNQLITRVLVDKSYNHEINYISPDRTMERMAVNVLTIHQIDIIIEAW